MSRQVMNLVELTPLRNSLVGVPGSTGLSVEQRKRLTIAVELVANPSIIFMDEPTTGEPQYASPVAHQITWLADIISDIITCSWHPPFQERRVTRIF